MRCATALFSSRGRLEQAIRTDRAPPSRSSMSAKNPPANVPAFSCERQRPAEGRPTTSSVPTPCWPPPNVSLPDLRSSNGSEGRLNQYIPPQHQAQLPPPPPLHHTP